MANLQIIEHSFFGDDAVFHHVGMGVRSINSVSAESHPIEDPIQKVRVAFVSINGLVVELVEPVGEKSPILQSLNNGTKLLHLCFSVPDIDVALNTSQRHGFRCIHKPVPAVAFDQNRIAWVFSLQHGLVELLEERPGEA